MSGLPSLVSSAGSQTYFTCWGCSVSAADDLWILQKSEVDKEQHETSLLLGMWEIFFKIMYKSKSNNCWVNVLAITSSFMFQPIESFPC